MTRPPAARTAFTCRAVASGTRYGSGNGGSPVSGEDTPACSTIGANSTPAATSAVTSSGVNARPALGISALPGCVANTVW